MKHIKRVSAVKPASGNIINSKELTDKVSNTYSAGVIDGLIQNQMITVTNAENQTTATQIEQVKFNYVFGKVGEQLSLKNYNVVIGKGISLIKVSGCLSTTYNSITDVLALRLLKNGTEILIMGNGKSSTGFSAQAILPSVILPVKEGDTITFNVSGNNAGITIQGGRCFLTVEKIE